MNSENNLDMTTKILFMIDDLMKNVTKNKIYFGETNLSIPDYRILRFIALTENCAVNKIVKHFSIPPSTATGILNKLEDREYVIRQINKQDRRKFIIQATEQGREVIEERDKAVQKEMKGLLKILTEEEKKQLITITEKLVNYFGK